MKEKLSNILNLYQENLTDSQIEQIIFDQIEYRGEKAKYALVFGHPEYLSYRVKEAIRLYKLGKIKKIILSGGIGRNDTISTESEAIKMKKIALDEGIPEEDLILEDKSTTTIENVKNVKKYFETEGEEVDSIILISSIWHMRRCLAICCKYLNDVSQIILAPVHDNVAESKNWMKTDIGRKLIKDEIKYLTKHINQELISDLEINFEVQKDFNEKI